MPKRMPAFGSLAVPSPMKNLMKLVIGSAVRDSLCATTAEACGSESGWSAGSPLATAAEGWAVGCWPPSSRRDNASAVHSTGSTAGEPPPFTPSQESKFAPALTDPGAAARTAGCDADTITGAESTISAAPATTAEAERLASTKVPSAGNVALSASGRTWVARGGGCTEAGPGVAAPSEPAFRAPSEPEPPSRLPALLPIGDVADRSRTSAGTESEGSASDPASAVDPRPDEAGAASEDWPLGRRGPFGSAFARESESAELFGDGDEPAEPPVSAATMGMTPNGATDVPRPRAMASAPTRPTNAAAPRPADSRGTFEPSDLGSAGDFASPIGLALLWSSCIRLPSRCSVLGLQISSALDQFSAGIKPHFSGESSTQSEFCETYIFSVLLARRQFGD